MTQSGRDGEFVGEDGELVGLAVAVGVLANLDPVTPLAGFLQFVGVVHRLGDPQASSLVEGHADGLEDEGIGRPELCLKTLTQDDPLGGFGRGQRSLHLGDFFAFGAPALARQVVGHRMRRLLIRQRVEAAFRTQFFNGGGQRRGGDQEGQQFAKGVHAVSGLGIVDPGTEENFKLWLRLGFMPEACAAAVHGCR